MTLVMMLPGLGTGRAHASPPRRTAPDVLLARADHVMSVDRQRFTQLLQQLHQIQGSLSPGQRQHLELLDAIRADMAGDSARAIDKYRDILDHPIEPLVEVRARAALITLYLQQRKYIEAYTLANALMQRLPQITDHRVRLIALKILIRVLDSEEQYDQAIRYADQLGALSKRQAIHCEAGVFRTQDMLKRGDSPVSIRASFHKTIETCRAANLLGYSDSLRLDWAAQMTRQGRPDQAIAYLHRIAPSVVKGAYQPLVATLEVYLSQAYLEQDEYDAARQHALRALTASEPENFNWGQETAYRILYRIDKHQGDFRHALQMHEKYTVQHQLAEDRAKAQAVAYQMVKQDVLAKKLKVEELGRKNKVLLLRQSLDRKSAETNRLYILLLILIVVSIAFWAYRIKHSQLRFRRMARHDDLTGLFNRQHFLDQAELLLDHLHKTGGHACLMILDMDHFKRVNDAHGHAAGDVVLRHVSRLCQQELRDSDVFGRLGGEEFGILMPDCTTDRGMEVGERIRHALALAPVNVRENERVTVTTSIGLACTETHGHALKPLLAAADEALYAAKRGGRNKLMAQPEEPASPTI